MFFTAINQMMTEGVDLTLVIRKNKRTTGSIHAAEVERAEGRGSEPHRTLDGQREARGTGRGIPANRRTPDTESGGTNHQHGSIRGAGGEGRIRK